MEATNHDGDNYIAQCSGTSWSNLSSLVGMGNGGAMCSDLSGKVYASSCNSTNGVYVTVYK